MSAASRGYDIHGYPIHTSSTKKKTTMELPEPLVKPLRHPMKWTKNKIQLLGVGFIFTYVGVLFIAGLYYLLFQVWPPATEGWHNVGPDVFGMTEGSWKGLRHNIRDVGEGFLGGLLAQMIVWNHYKKKNFKKPKFLDKMEMKLRIPNVKDARALSKGELIAAIPLCMLYAIPGFLLGEWIVTHFHPNPAVFEAHTIHGHAVSQSLLEKVKGNFTENYPTKVMGFGAAFFFGRRPAKAVYDDIQLWFAERRCAQGKKLNWYQVPTFKARYNEVCATGGYDLQTPSKKQVAITATLLTFCAGVAGFGFYVLNFIAK